MEYLDQGTLAVRVYTAGGALPLQNAVVRVTGADEDNRFVEYSVLTDEDGLTKIITLPTPSKSYSLAPGAVEAPYAIYDIEITSDGFYTKHINSAAVFSGVKSYLEVNMIPVSLIENGLYPRGNLDAVVYENEKL